MEKPLNMTLATSQRPQTAHQRLAQAQATLGLSPTAKQQDLLLEFLQQLLRWNKTYNLTAIRDPEQALVQHVFDSLAVIAPIQRLTKPVASNRATLLDVGSGAGLPGIVCAIMLPDVPVSCIDAVEKKTTFIKQMIGVLALHNLSTSHVRVESLAPSESTVVISRAFASLRVFANLAGAHVAQAGHLVAMKAKVSSSEITELETNTRWRVDRFEPLTVPELQAERCLVWMRREGNQ